MIARALRLLLIATSAAFALCFLGLALMRLRYPIELDYIEGVMMDHLVRLVQGRPMYVEPTLEFITLAYMPGFAVVSSLLARVFGVEFWVPRAVSLVSMLGLAALTMRVLRLETRSWTLAIAGAGVLLGSFGVTGGHFDVGRPDSLMLFLSLSGLATLRFTTSVRGALLAALILTCAFFTKQHAVWFAILATVHLAVNDRRRFVPFGIAIAVGCIGGYVLTSLIVGPWFSFYTWDIPTRWSSISKARILNYAGRGLLGSHALLVLPTLLSFGLREKPWRGPQGLWIFAGVAGVLTGFMATLDPDAYRHVMNPTVMTFSILGPLSLWRLAPLFDPDRPRRAMLPSVLYAVLLLQFIPLIYAVRSHMPHPRALEARDELVRIIAHHDGPVIMLYHGFYTTLAGKGSSLQQISIDDIIRAPGNRLLTRDPGYFERLLAPLMAPDNKTMIITDVRLSRSGSESNPLWQEVAKHYTLAGNIHHIAQRLNPVDGNHWTPRYIYVPLAPGEVAQPDTASVTPSLVAPD